MNAPFLPADDRAATNAAEFTVSEIARAVKFTVEDRFGHVRVRGEIGNFRGRHSSGHAYFALKDDGACLDAVVWRSAWAKLGVAPEEGLEVIATGRLTTFAKKSSYQIMVENLEPAGVGALMKLLDERRKKLAAEGLFDEARKRPLPVLPRTIGVVTSPTGAVIRDILHRLADRFPSHVVVWPVRVQGETSGAEVTRAVEGFAGDYGGPQPDLIIVARGGGSVEDLWGYNDEALVQAVAASPIPVVSAVGHETDWTLIDHAADHRAPTPTGAAERVVPVRSDLLATLADRARRLDIAADGRLERARNAARLLGHGLPSPADVLAPQRQRLDLADDRLVHALYRSAADARRRYLTAAVRLTPEVAARVVALSRERAGTLDQRLTRAIAAQLAAARRTAEAVAARVSPRLLKQPLSFRAERLGTVVGRLDRSVAAAIVARRGEAAGVGRRLRPEVMSGRMSAAATARDRLASRADRAIAARLADAAARTAAAAKLLRAVSYQAVLERGFALVRRAHDDREPVFRAAGVGTGERLSLEFADGTVQVIEGDGAAAPRRPALERVRPRAKRQRPTNDDQGVLF